MKKWGALSVGTALVVAAISQFEIVQEYVPDMPKVFLKHFLGIALWQWIGIAAALVVSAFAAVVARSIMRRVTIIRDRYVPQAMSAPTRLAIERSTLFFAGAGLFLFLTHDLELPGRASRLIDVVATGVTHAGLVFLIAGWWDAVCDSIAARSVGIQRAERLLVPVMRKLVRATILVTGVLVAIGIYGGTKAITSLIATLGISGLVVALAAKDSVENLFGSFTILLDMPFALGDWVKIDKAEGIVEEINLRSTRIRTFEDTVITLPNANLIRASVENYGARRFRRQKLLLRLSYDCQPAAIDAYAEALRSYLRAQEYVNSETVQIELNDPTDVSIGLQIVCHYEGLTADQEARRRHEMLQEALRLRKVHGVVFAAAPRPPDPV